MRDAPTAAEGRVLALRYMQAHVIGDLVPAAELTNVIGPNEMLWHLSELLGWVLSGGNSDRDEEQTLIKLLSVMVDLALDAICDA